MYAHERKITVNILRAVCKKYIRYKLIKSIYGGSFLFHTLLYILYINFIKIFKYNFIEQEVKTKEI